MIQDFYIGQGDTGPDLVVQLTDDKGQPITKSLVGATYKFYLKNGENNAIILNGEAADTVGADYNTTKIIGYAWQTGDTDTPASRYTPHKGQFQVTYSDGTVESFPNNDWIRVHVMAD